MDAGPNLLRRVAVVGTSCAGKTTFARRLVPQLDGATHIQLDELYWGPNWTPRPRNEVRHDVDVATQGERWVSDGNYSALSDIVWARADTIIWLNYSWATVLSRALRRTIRRAWTQEPLYAGNRESWRQSFFSRDSILLWVLRTHNRRRRDYSKLFAQPQHARLSVVELRTPRGADAFLDFFQNKIPDVHTCALSPGCGR